MNNTLRFILICAVSFVFFIPLHGENKDTPEIIITRNLEAELIACSYKLGNGKHVNLLNCTTEEYISFVKELIASPDQDKVGDVCKKALIEIVSLGNDPQKTGFLNISPIFNRSLLISMVAVHNKIRLDEEDMKNLQTTCIANGDKGSAHDRAMIMTLYSAMERENAKLGR